MGTAAKSVGLSLGFLVSRLPMFNPKSRLMIEALGEQKALLF